MKSYHSDNSRRRSPPTEEEITSTCTFPLYKIYISFFFLYTYVLLNITLFSLSLSLSLTRSHIYIFTYFISSLIHARTRITPMRKTKILLSVLDAPSKAHAQQGQLIDWGVHLCVEIVLVFVFLRINWPSVSSCILSLFPWQQRPELETDLFIWVFIMYDEKKKTQGERENKRLQSGPSDMHTFYTVSVYIYNI